MLKYNKKNGEDNMNNKEKTQPATHILKYTIGYEYDGTGTEPIHYEHDVAVEVPELNIEQARFEIETVMNNLFFGHKILKANRLIKNNNKVKEIEKYLIKERIITFEIKNIKILEKK